MTRRIWPRVPLVGLGVAIGAIGLWAAQATIGNRLTASPDQPPMTYTVGEETVERSMPVVVVAERSREVVAVNLLDGIVTRVPDIEGSVSTGDVVYEVAGVPIRVVEGAVPFYRELGPGLAGEDVRQLQAALVALGHLEIEPDGRFEASTAAGVRAWRRELRLGDGERVALGELIAIPDLPRFLSIGEEIRVGRLAPVGSDALFVLSEEPTFELPLTQAQAQAIDPAATLVVVHEGLEWPAVIAATEDDPDRGQVVLHLAGSDGGPVCGEACDTLPAAGRSQLRGRLVSVPPTSGPAVPVAALRTDADGTVWVRLETGGRRQVEVLASAGGLAVVDGIEIGERLLVDDPSSGGEDD